MKVEVLLGHWLARASPIWLVVFSILSVQVGTAIAIHLAVAGAECNTVIELKPEHHAALPWHFA